MGWEPFSSSSQDLPTDLKSITILCRHSKWAWIFCTIPTEFQLWERPLIRSIFGQVGWSLVLNWPKQSHFIGYMVGFPRNGTSRCPFVPEQGQEQMSRDKTLCPGTSLGKIFSLSRCPFVPGQGQEQMSRDKTLCPGTSRDKMS